MHVTYLCIPRPQSLTSLKSAACWKVLAGGRLPHTALSAGDIHSLEEAMLLSVMVMPVRVVDNMLPEVLRLLEVSVRLFRVSTTLLYSTNDQLAT